ncbi:BTB/POZ domain-containing protein 6 [Stylophora pistillata]|uniref:BTB/POZ domain-containing protein 6 n=1 Tax=Stylophora pistillata TaxID=50429 RepID=A0A2B4R9G8_STYPI|nr:BTB/POZ domain-containing protein 6 [Stylophora pistillata]
MYSDEVNLSGSNVMGVLYLAKKYIVPSLAENCSKYLSKNLDPSNVFSILPSAQKYEEKDLVDRCWEMIDEQTAEAVESDGFATIQRSLFESLVVRDTLRIKEVKLFKAVDLWATNECERQGLGADGANKRRILGEETVKAIRFPTMTLEDFASVVLDSKILNSDEVSSIIKYLSSVSSSTGGFSDSERSPISHTCGDIQRCYRFKNFRGLLSDECGMIPAFRVIEFFADRDLWLHGVYICGISSISNCPIELSLWNKKRKLTEVSGKFSAEIVHRPNEKTKLMKTTVQGIQEEILESLNQADTLPR